MTFTTEMWFGLCKLITYQLVKLLTSFVPTQRGPTLVSDTDPIKFPSGSLFY